MGGNETLALHFLVLHDQPLYYESLGFPGFMHHLLSVPCEPRAQDVALGPNFQRQFFPFLLTTPQSEFLKKLPYVNCAPWCKIKKKNGAQLHGAQMPLFSYFVVHKCLQMRTPGTYILHTDRQYSYTVFCQLRARAPPLIRAPP